MTDPNFFILYVDNPPASASFYTTLLGRPPVESSPGFAMFALDSGVMLGLWKRQEVTPVVDNFGATMGSRQVLVRLWPLLPNSPVSGGLSPASPAVALGTPGLATVSVALDEVGNGSATGGTGSSISSCSACR